jgi:pilus assembly protein CpaB
MNMKTVIPLGLAVLLGLVAAVMVRNTIAHRGSVLPANSNLVSVVVAKQDIDPGKSLTKEDLVVAKVPAEAAPGHVFSDPNQLVGRVSISPLAKGQTILETLLASIGSGSGLQALIPPGMRAVTLEVNEFSSVGGMLEPGCRVDLISTLNDPKTHESMAKTVLQNVKVTAIGRNVTPVHPVDGQPAPPPSNNVTLLLTLKQAQMLELACMAGRPWLVLRSYRDNAEQPLEATALSTLRGDASDSDGSSMTAQPAITPTNTPPNFINPASDPMIEPAPTTIRRTVTFIKNGVESQVTFTIPAPNAQAVDTSSDRSTVPGAQ